MIYYTANIITCVDWVVNKYQFLAADVSLVCNSIAGILPNVMLLAIPRPIIIMKTLCLIIGS